MILAVHIFQGYMGWLIRGKGKTFINLNWSSLSHMSPSLSHVVVVLQTEELEKSRSEAVEASKTELVEPSQTNLEEKTQA